jgi:predicted RNase H-like nuclease
MVNAVLLVAIRYTQQKNDITANTDSVHSLICVHVVLFVIVLLFILY